MEINGLYSALGVSEGAAEETVDTQEVTDPVGTEETEGGTEQEVADPADGTEGAEDGKGRQSKAENQKFARQRREQEKQQAIEAAVAAERQRFEKILQTAGLIDPTSKNGKISSIEQLERRATTNAAKEAAKALNESGDLTEEQLLALMQSTESGRKMLRDNAQVQNEKLNVYRQQQLSLISKMDPQIKTFEDLQKIPEFQEFENYVRDNGLSWDKAYRLACGERLAQKGAAAARQQALNNIGGKSHMTHDATRGGDGVDLPKDIEAMYKMMDPTLTHEQCVTKFRNYLNRTKKG